MVGIWIATLVITGAVLVSFAWGSVCYLRLGKEPNLRMRLMAMSVYLWLAVYGAAMVVSLPRRPPVAWLSVAVVLFLLSLWFFWGAVWAHKSKRPAYAFTKEPPAWFAWHGPYRYVRHPIYTSYLLGFAAGACLPGNPLLLPLLLLSVPWLGAFYYTAAKQEEQAFSESEFAEDYKAYRAATGMFLPKPRSLLFPFAGRSCSDAQAGSDSGEDTAG